MKRLIAGALIVWSACASAQACLPGEPNPNWKPVIASMFSSSDYVLLARVADWTNNTKLTECGTNAGAIAPESMTEPRTRPSCNSLNVAFDTIEVFKGPDVKRLRLSSFGSRFVAADEAKLLPSGVVAAPLVAKDYNDWGLKTRYLVIGSTCPHYYFYPAAGSYVVSGGQEGIFAMYPVSSNDPLVLELRRLRASKAQ